MNDLTGHLGRRTILRMVLITGIAGLFSANVFAVTPSPFFSSPEDPSHEQVIAHIQTAQKSIDMWMFHITDTNVIDALCQASQNHRHVRAILNRSMFADGKSVIGQDGDGISSQLVPDIRFDGSQPQVAAGGTFHDQLTKISIDQKSINSLQDCGVDVIESSKGFSITHAKTLVLDRNRALIMTMNMTERADRTRDVGILIHDPSIVSDLLTLFASDVANAENGTHLTPAFDSDALIVAPMNATSRLVELIQHAQTEISLVVENIGATQVTDALIAAAAGGVKVRVMAPLCDLIPKHYYNLDALRLLQANGAEVMAMPGKASTTQPYLHEKMMLIDGDTYFLGSENISKNSLSRAREIGLVQKDADISGYLRTIYNTDWSNAVAVPSENPTDKCESF